MSDENDDAYYQARDEADSAQFEVEKLKRKLAIATEALRFYGDHDNHAMLVVQEDWGKKAEEALKEIES